MGRASKRTGPAAALVGLLLLASAAVAPVAPVAWSQPRELVDEIESTQRDLREARAGLGGLRAQVLAAERTLASADAAIARHAAHLRALEGRLATAREVEAAATARTLAVSRRLQDAHDRLDALVARRADHESALRERVVATYKRGAPAGNLVSLVVEARHLHDVAVARRTLQAMAHDDRRLVARSGELRASAIANRHDVANLRAEAAGEQRQAAAARGEVERLVAAQRRALADLEAERGRRAAVLAEFEADEARGAALVNELTRRTAALSARLSAELVAAYGDGAFDGPAPPWVERLPAAGRSWAKAISDASVAVRLDPRLFAGVVWAESAFQPGAVSRAGAIGLAQLMPATAAGLGVDPWDPVQNLRGGSRYLRIQVDRFGTLDLALAAYNAGPGAVERHGGIPPYVETQFYVLRVLGLYQSLLTP